MIVFRERMESLSIKKLGQCLVCLAVISIPFYFLRFQLLGIRTNIFEIIVLATFLSALYFLLLAKKKPTLGQIWPYLFLVAGVAGLIVAGDKAEAAGIYKGWFLVPFLLYFSVINFFEQKDLLKLSFAGYVSMAVIGLWGLFQSWQLFGLLFYQQGDPGLIGYIEINNFRLIGPFESPNYYAMFIVPMIFLSLPAMSIFRNFKKSLFLLSLLPFAIAIYTLFLTQSRGGIIALTVCFLILVFTRIRSLPDSRKKWVITLAMIAVLLLGILIFGASSVNRGGSDDSRKSIYKYSLEMIKESPILGIGMGNFKEKITELSEDNPDFQRTTLQYALHPHNVFLAIWLNLGIIGFISFLIILIKFFTKVRFSGKNIFNLMLALAMLAVLIHGLFDTTYFKNDLSAILWLILALSLLKDTHGKKDS